MFMVVESIVLFYSPEMGHLFLEEIIELKGWAFFDEEEKMG